jgi:hypothetical protein
LVTVGDRVYVDSFLVSGYGTVVYIAINEFFFPVGVELDKGEGDIDGHRYFRFAYNEVKKGD